MATSAETAWSAEDYNTALARISNLESQIRQLRLAIPSILAPGINAARAAQARTKIGTEMAQSTDSIGDGEVDGDGDAKTTTAPPRTSSAHRVTRAELYAQLSTAAISATDNLSRFKRDWQDPATQEMLSRARVSEARDPDLTPGISVEFTPAPAVAPAGRSTVAPAVAPAVESTVGPGRVG